MPVVRLHDKHEDLQLTVSFAVPVNDEFIFHAVFYFGGKPCWATAFIQPVEEFRDALQVPMPHAPEQLQQQLAA
ncbi:hypothetical protein HY992_06455 [Candidatus Micrarchaeota archaeon]|nr:hypothetical protein [Candidatus Micrarchaeota archaeon]